MIPDFELARLKAAGQLAEIQQTVESLTEALQQLDLWQPQVGLVEQGRVISEMLENLVARLDRKLTVVLVGPCGSGKSTLVNALLGGAAVVETGIQRPTTREVTVCCRQPGDAAHLTGSENANRVRIETRGFPAHLDHLVLVDTPDTDSTAQEAHLPLIIDMIRHADILVCVFNAENPKTKSHSDVLAPLVAYFDGQALVAVLNKCDRLDADELQKTILPQSAAYLRQSWQKSPRQVLAVCARCQLQDPAWDAQARPRHGLDQFAQLAELLSVSSANARTIVDQRLEKARHLSAYLRQQVRQAADQAQPALTKALALMTEAEQAALQTALEAFGRSDRELSDTTHAYLHQQLAQRWVGPMGWLLAGWLRVVLFSSGLFSLVRWRRPLRQLGTMWRAVRPTPQTDPQQVGQQAGAGVTLALQAYGRKLESVWPDVAEQLVQAGMAPEVRDSVASRMDAAALQQVMHQEWFTRWQTETHRVARRLSHPLLQIVFNLPMVGLMGYIGWITVRTFVGGTYLPTGFFVHALMAMAFVTGLSFTLFQLWAKAFGRSARIHRRTLLGIAGQPELIATATHPRLRRTVERILQLARLR